MDKPELQPAKAHVVSYLDNPIVAAGTKIMPTPKNKQSGDIVPAVFGSDDVVNELTKEQWHKFLEEGAFRVLVDTGKLRVYASSSEAKIDWYAKRAKGKKASPKMPVAKTPVASSER